MPARGLVGRAQPGAVGALSGTVDTRFAGLCMSRHACLEGWLCRWSCLGLICCVVYVPVCAPDDLRGWSGWLSHGLSSIACAGMRER